jgi:hypothetical protein
MDHPDPDPLVVRLLNPAIEAVIGETGQSPTHRSENGTFLLQSARTVGRRKPTLKEPATNANDALGVDEEAVFGQADAHQAVTVADVVVNQLLETKE